jgi:hypothetical protein
MATASLAYRDFVRICHAVRRLRHDGASTDLWFIRNALVKHFQTDHPAIAARIFHLTTLELETLVALAERHHAAARGKAAGRSLVAPQHSLRGRHGPGCLLPTLAASPPPHTLA